MSGSSPTESHRAAADLFDRTADSYRNRSEARVYNTSSFGFARRKEVVLALLDSSGASGTLLDYGMGPAVFAPEAVGRGFHFVGLDISSAMVEHAQALGLDNVTYQQGDLETLAEYRGAADVVMAIGLIDYLEDPRDGIRQLVECLKPGGTIIISFTNRWSMYSLLRKTAKVIWRTLFGGAKWRQETAFASSVHEHAFSFRTQLRPALSEMGVGEFRVRYFNCSPLFFNIPIPKPIWSFWCACDRVLARPFTRWFCAAGVLSGRKTTGPAGHA